jgi:hypothetical protein
MNELSGVSIGQACAEVQLPRSTYYNIKTRKEKGTGNPDDAGGYGPAVHKKYGPPRNLDELQEQALCDFATNVDAYMANSEYGNRGSQIEGVGKQVSKSTVQRTFGERQIEAGKKPIVEKAAQKLPYFDNKPKWLDMCCGYAEWCTYGPCGSDDVNMAHEDETSVGFNRGAGKKRGRARRAGPIERAAGSPGRRRRRVDLKSMPYA